ASAGTLVDNGDGTWTLTPAANFTGAVTLTYAVTDGHGGTLSGQTRGITLAAVNDAPAGAPTATLAAGTEDTPYVIHASDLLAGFSDAEGDTLSVSGLSASAGTLVDNGDGTWTLTPAAGFSGAVALSYAVTDGHGGTLAGQTRGVTFASTVIPPTGVSDTFTLLQNASGVALDVLANDEGGDPTTRRITQVNDTALAVGQMMAVAGGTVLLSVAGQLVFTPGTDFHGSTAFTYGFTDSTGATGTGTVTGAVVRADELPLATADHFTLGSSGSSVAIDVVANDSHPGGAALTITQVNGHNIAAGRSVDVRGGQVLLNEHNTLVFTADPAFSGSVSFSYTAVDTNGFGAEATVTSSAALATLAPQIDAALDAHGLPRVADLGDLLAIASVVAPGAFGTAETTQGYHAGPGYALDLDTANANPDLLMQALLAIVGAQTSGTGHEVLTADASGSWTSSIDQSLVFQAALADSSDLELDLGADGTSALSLQPTMSAWSRAFAQQMLSADVSADFVTQSDGHAQAYSYQSTVAAGSQLSVDINGQTAGTPQAALSNLYGFVDFVSADGQSSVEVARTVMVAQTAGGADDQHATVTMRQNGVLHVQVEFYRVDDYSGTIDGLHPGDAGYDAASQARAYQTTAGGTWISGAGYGELSTAELIGINSGDLVVMRLETPDHDFYAFAEANEVSNGTHVNHIWNYGLNTWGWEDLYGGGDQDFNDLVVRLDFNQQNALSGELV
ncbi:cadherin-like domain-containing protein, partial [Xanthobacter sp. V0B-10]